jgi:hypothetical protein
MAIIITKYVVVFIKKINYQRIKQYYILIHLIYLDSLYLTAAAGLSKHVEN